MVSLEIMMKHMEQTIRERCNQCEYVYRGSPDLKYHMSMHGPIGLLPASTKGSGVARMHGPWKKYQCNVSLFNNVNKKYTIVSHRLSHGSSDVSRCYQYEP